MSAIRKMSRDFATPDDARAWWELAISFALYAMGMIVALGFIGHWWVMIPAMAFAATMGLRLYMIQHDCLHRSFFTGRMANDVVGTLLSPIAMTPFQATRYKHNLHHAHVGDLDRRDAFEIDVMTLREYEAAPLGQKIRYRIYRSPLILVVIGPFLLYAVLRRVPLYGLKTGLWDLVLHNAMLFAYLWAVWVWTGWAGIGVFYGIVYIATFFGGLIPYILHNFETVHWGVKPDLDFETAALKGSAVLDLGPVFDLAMMNIGYHDLHHLNAKIPGYKLRAAHRALEDAGLISSTRIGLWDGLRCLRWKLYDEEHGRMVPFPPLSRGAMGLPAE
ncbi:omega-6 fatty acid desaturase (delta-12 desaturase) [Roseivivax lentus]|uniref:Omega-6 fatty acid desaturase (Delta-12 desaturase) n=1 Tax=Roseivivax lentus TaxID=633194 RepID=A0A1N7K5Z7_9RHOB|nr:fatty acid desaturase [Roseivivax lentus]SIS56966.1 omega-6 fatty acid desaturase (delta-12 desaturase) [Roseivivax lentus]